MSQRILAWPSRSFLLALFAATPLAGCAGFGLSGAGFDHGDGGSSSGFEAAAASCVTQMSLDSDLVLGGYHVDRYHWRDAHCSERQAALVQNNATDPGGSRGGYLRSLVWSNASGTQTEGRGTGVNGWNGWGYVVNHYASTSDSSTGHTGTFTRVLGGAHHALHEFKVRMSPGGPLDVTIHWFFADGRTHPVYAITFDASPAGPNALNADTRAPYGDLAFEGTAGGAIGGVGWGDKYRFTTTGAGPVTFYSSWDYTQPNVVPYVRMWSAAVDAEMGAVQTQSFDQHVAGGDYGAGLLAQSCWGRTSANQGADCHTSGYTLPTDWLWPFQLDQYELPSNSTSHRVAWGSNYGAIGQQSVSAFGKTFSGYPKVSYSVFMVVDPHSADATLSAAQEIERMLGAELTASVGTVLAQAPAGAGRTDLIALSPAGYDPVYATWDVAAASNQATFTLSPKAGALDHPVFRISGFTAAQLQKVTLGQSTLSPERDYAATLDTAHGTLWLTLNGTVKGTVTVHVE